MRFTIRDLLWVMALVPLFVHAAMCEMRMKAICGSAAEAESHLQAHHTIIEWCQARIMNSAYKHDAWHHDHDLLMQQSHGIISNHEQRIDALEKAEPTP